MSTDPGSQDTFLAVFKLYTHIKGLRSIICNFRVIFFSRCTKSSVYNTLDKLVGYKKILFIPFWEVFGKLSYERIPLIFLQLIMVESNFTKPSSPLYWSFSSFGSTFIQKMCFGWLRYVGLCTFHTCFVRYYSLIQIFTYPDGWNSAALTSSYCVLYCFEYGVFLELHFQIRA